MLPPTREEQVQARPRRADTGAVDREALEVGVTGEEQDWGEEHGERLEGACVLRGDERRKEGWWEGRLCRECQQFCKINL